MKGSPVNADFLQQLQWERKSNTAVYIQLAQQFIRLIQNGSLPMGSRLPGTRTVATILQIHRKTAVATYEELEQQGWIEQRPNRGSFVLHPTEKNPLTTPVRAKNRKRSSSSIVGFNLSSSPVVRVEPEEEGNYRYRINYGWADERLDAVSELYNRYHTVSKRRLGKSNAEPLRFSQLYCHVQLRNYLQINRGITLGDNQILTTRGAERALQAVIQLVIRPGDSVIVGQLGRSRAHMHLLQAGAKLHPLAIDERGLDITALEFVLQSQRIRAVYINSSAHFPTTVSLSAARRLRLLQLAQIHGFVIIEDESEVEIQYESSVKMPLFGMDEGRQVIYVGGLGQALMPHLQTGFVLAHSQVINELQHYISLLEPHTDYILQHTLAELIDDGDWMRLHKKLLQVYRTRRDFAVNWIVEYANAYWNVQSPAYGLGIFIVFQRPISLLRWQQELRQLGIYIPRELLHQSRQYTAVRFGFGDKTTAELQEILEQMRTVTAALSS